MILLLLIFVFLLLWGVYALFCQKIWHPFKRIAQHAETMAEGKASTGYVSSGLGSMQAVIKNLQIVDQRMQQLSSSVRVEEFSLKTILASMVEGVIVTDTDSVIQVANQAFMDMFKITQDPVKRPLMDVVLQSDIKAIIDHALKTGKDHAGEAVVEDVLDEQHRRVFQVSVSPLGMMGEKAKGVVVVFHDISRTKQLEVLRREFVANVSHELRTPLAIFHGYLETILDNHELPAEEIQRVLKVMKRHSDRLNELVVDLLTLSRLESGQIKLEPVKVDICLLLGRLQADWSGLLAKKQCQMVIKCPDLLPTIEVDILRIEQVFYNLLENALKYSDDGKEIEVGVVFKAKMDYLDFYVKDYGTGIPSDKVGHIFQRFYRVDRSRSRDKGGTGLGLAIVKHIVQLHGGSVRADSILGEGTTVWFRMPLKFV